MGLSVRGFPENGVAILDLLIVKSRLNFPSKSIAMSYGLPCWLTGTFGYHREGPAKGFSIIMPEGAAGC